MSRGSTGGAVPSIPLAHLRSIMEPTRALANTLGQYFGATPLDPIGAITSRVTGLSPTAWPVCKHCGGNVNCEDYDPDTSGPLWGEAK